ncbi:MAG: VWA domain-containing protein [Planctomycetes bacterium]|nr:VWA domain-containing protein [Planctomycetota bacterium]
MKQARANSLSHLVWWALVAPSLGLAALIALLLVADPEATSFDRLDLGWLAALSPAAGLMMYYGGVRRRRARAAFSSAKLAPLLTVRLSLARRAFRGGLVAVALLLTAAAVVGPRWGTYLEERKAFGVDIVVALDVSRSMYARDLSPNRIEHAKRVIRQQLAERSTLGGSNRLGLLAFAGNTSMKAPLSLDHTFFRNAVDRTHVGSAPRGGTAIAAAIREAANFFSASSEEATKIILVFTDGEDHDSDPVGAAREAYETDGVRTFMIGVGDMTSPTGAQVPESDAPGARPLLYDGQIVFSKPDVVGMRLIAEAGDGRYASLGDFPLLVDAIAEMQRTHLSTEHRVRHKPQYQWFLAAALVLLTLETMLGDASRAAEPGPVRAWQQEAAT